MKDFIKRHIGISEQDFDNICNEINVKDTEELIYKTIPDNIRMEGDLNLPEPITENEYLDYIKTLASKNKIFKSYIGQGYYGTILPPVIQRNIFENPGWYTQYTPYQAEISQGRLEALINFQTMVSDLTGLEIANASLLDEGTAAAEAMWMMYDIFNKKRKKDKHSKLFVDKYVFEQTKSVLEVRAEARNIEIVYGDVNEVDYNEEYFGAIIQYPNSIGNVVDYREIISKFKEVKIPVTMMADILSLCVLESPGKLGAEIAVGSTQRFGVPMGFGGPHAAYFATTESNKRRIPGRIIGVSHDRNGKLAYRMALQTREQHIKREKATSNICTAQALLAIMAGFYGVYHGKEGLIEIANDVFTKTSKLQLALEKVGIKPVNNTYFDTLTYELDNNQKQTVKEYLENKEINIFYREKCVSISCDEKTQTEELNHIVAAFAKALNKDAVKVDARKKIDEVIEKSLLREEDFMTHEVFNKYRSETELMRYMKRLENRDLSLTHSMISLGSCTMKLNAAVEMLPVSWAEFGEIHPFAPENQVEGYLTLIKELNGLLCEITGFVDGSFQPNSGAQGEFTGLMVIRQYHKHNNQAQRNVALVPSSAHGTNPASAIMAGMEVIIVASDENGNVDVADLREKAEKYKDRLAAFMITYPSTHGVFEKSIVEMCDIIHNNGGLVYMDGANMNAQIGLTKPGIIGADVCHLNLHKTFAIPHGGGGPGVGPIFVNEKLAKHLPSHVYSSNKNSEAISSVSSAAYGSAGVLMISYAYIRLMGAKGLKRATETAILSANYLKEKLSKGYKTVYTNSMGMVAHEMILDLRMYKQHNITAEDIAKRLMDYGFHAPTVSFPVIDTFMIEPTESESKEELDKFIGALLNIKEEINDIIEGRISYEDSPIANAPHTAAEISSDNWDRKYSREQAVFPLEYLKEGAKFWPFVGRIDNAYGDRNLFCSCPTAEMYAEKG